jgi:hypothetical protein
MSKWVVDIHGDIEGDYEIIKKYEEPKAEWIPVSERLPEASGIFLTYIVNPYDSRLSYIMLCDYIGQTWCPVDETASSNVIAWMPLPEPYVSDINVGKIAESEGK